MSGFLNLVRKVSSAVRSVRFHLISIVVMLNVESYCDDNIWLQVRIPLKAIKSTLLQV